MKFSWLLLVVIVMVMSRESVAEEKYNACDASIYISTISEGNTNPTIEETVLGTYRVEAGIIFVPIDTKSADYMKKRGSPIV